MDLITGTIVKANTDKENGKPHSFKIEGDNGEIYFGHLGDIKHNEEKLYEKHNKKTLFLEKGDKVKFQSIDQEKYPEKYLLAIHIEKTED